MDALEVFDRIAVGQMMFHRCDDAWDLIETQDW
jgi:hypothetical protein